MGVKLIRLIGFKTVSDISPNIGDFFFIKGVDFAQSKG